jgi:hypothetical protein
LKRTLLTIAAASSIILGAFAPAAMAKTVSVPSKAWSHDTFEVDGTPQYGLTKVEGFTYQSAQWVSAYAVVQLLNQVNANALWVGHTLYLLNSGLDASQLPAKTSGDANVVADGQTVMKLPHLVEKPPVKGATATSYLRISDVEAILKALGYTYQYNSKQGTLNVQLPAAASSIIATAVDETPGQIVVTLSAPVSSVDPSDFTVTDSTGTLSVTNASLDASGTLATLTVPDLPSLQSGAISLSVSYDGSTPFTGGTLGPVSIEALNGGTAVTGPVTLSVYNGTASAIDSLQAVDASNAPYAGTVTYASSNPSVVEVTTDGKIIGMSAGTATITATDPQGDTIAPLTVTVATAQ